MKSHPKKRSVEEKATRRKRTKRINSYAMANRIRDLESTMLDLSSALEGFRQDVAEAGEGGRDAADILALLKEAECLNKWAAEYHHELQVREAESAMSGKPSNVKVHEAFGGVGFIWATAKVLEKLDGILPDS
jgi:hypothetical protein